MRKTICIIIVITVMFLCALLTSCDNHLDPGDDYKEKEESLCEETNIEISFEETDQISFDKKNERAKFDDGVISYSWDTNKWHFCLYNGKPQLESPWNKLQIKFSILADHNGVAEDFWKHAMSGLMEFYGESSQYVWSHMFASTTDPYFNERGYFGERTGFYDMRLNKDSDPVKYNLAIVHVVTDGKKTAVLCISANGFKENIIDLHEIIFPERGFTSVLEDITSNIVDTFAFYNDALETDKNDKNDPFGYRDAYDKFSEVYSWGSHAEYIEYVENEADKLKNEVFRTNNEIMEILKRNIILFQKRSGQTERIKSIISRFSRHTRSIIWIGWKLQRTLTKHIWVCQPL